MLKLIVMVTRRTKVTALVLDYAGFKKERKNPTMEVDKATDLISASFRLCLQAAATGRASGYYPVAVPPCRRLSSLPPGRFAAPLEAGIASSCGCSYAWPLRCSPRSRRRFSLCMSLHPSECRRNTRFPRVARALCSVLLCVEPPRTTPIFKPWTTPVFKPPRRWIACINTLASAFATIRHLSDAVSELL